MGTKRNKTGKNLRPITIWEAIYDCAYCGEPSDWRYQEVKKEEVYLCNGCKKRRHGESE